MLMIRLPKFVTRVSAPLPTLFARSSSSNRDVNREELKSLLLSMKGSTISVSLLLSTEESVQGVSQKGAPLSAKQLLSKLEAGGEHIPERFNVSEMDDGGITVSAYAGDLKLQGGATREVMGQTGVSDMEVNPRNAGSKDVYVTNDPPQPIG